MDQVTTNPYASPFPSFASGYYRVNLATARWREILRATRGNWPLFWDACSCKLFKRHCFTHAVHLGCTQFWNKDLPHDVADAMSHFRVALGRLGVELSVTYRQYTQNAEVWFLSGLSDDALVIPTVVHQRFGNGDMTYYSIGSYLTSDECLITTTESEVFDPPNWCSPIVLETSTSIEDLWHTHRRRLELSAVPPRAISDLREIITLHERRGALYLWERRLLHEVSEAEFQELREGTNAA